MAPPDGEIVDCNEILSKFDEADERDDSLPGVIATCVNGGCALFQGQRPRRNLTRRRPAGFADPSNGAFAKGSHCGLSESGRAAADESIKDEKRYSGDGKKTFYILTNT